MLIRIKPEQALLGMYIDSLEEGWFSHPFWRESFAIKTQRDLLRVRTAGSDLYIDTTRGRDLLPTASFAIDGEVAPRSAPRSSLLSARPASAARPVKKVVTRVVAAPSFGKADKLRAAALMQRSAKIVRDLFEDSRAGRPIGTAEIMTVVGDISNTLDSNSAAFASISRLKDKDDYTYTHSISVCAFMIILGRETNATAEAVRNLGVAGLLHDIGKLSIDEAILQKTDALEEDERAKIALHPQLGHAALTAQPGIPPVALDVCLHHHERPDGSGYPFGLLGDSVTPASRIAAICDVYDAMTSNRPYKKGMSPVEAITEMEASPGEFDSGLLFRFMRSIGVFPVGKLLRLRSNRLAIVLPSPVANRHPVVRTFYNTVESRFVDYEDVILSNQLCHDGAVSQEDPAGWFSGDWDLMKRRIRSGRPLITVPA